MENKIIKGAKIATIGLLITKALGILYVIPMNAMLSSDAMGVYGISYIQYAFFIQITLVGFPTGVSKIVAKYRAENNFTMVNRTFKYSVALVSLLGVVGFSVLFFGTDYVVKTMQVGVFDPDQVAITLKLLAPSLLIIPALAISRGYTQGFEDMLPSSISIVIEQVVRILIIVIGLILVVKVFKTDDMQAIYVATIASFFSAFIGYLFLVPGFRKYFGFARRNYSENDFSLGFRKLVEIVAVVSIPFIVLSTYKGLFEFLDSIMINRILDNFNISDDYIKETIIIYTIQIQKLVVLTLTIANGFTLSMIPALSSLHTKGEFALLRKRMTQLVLLSTFVFTFVSVFAAIFSKETYFVFFFTGEAGLGGSVFALSIISTIFYALFNVVGASLLTIHHVKPVVIAFISGIVVKIITGYIFGYIFNGLGIEPALVFATASFAGYIVSLTIVVRFCTKHKLLYTPRIVKVGLKIATSAIILAVVCAILVNVLPSITNESSGLSTYLKNIGVLLLSGTISLVVFLYSAEKLRYLKYLTGKSFKDLLFTVIKRAPR